MGETSKPDGYCWGCEVKRELEEMYKKRKERFRVNIHPDSEIGREIRRIADKVSDISTRTIEVKASARTNFDFLKDVRQRLERIEQGIAKINERLELQEALTSEKLSSEESVQHSDQK